MNENYARLQELMKDEAFVKEMLAQESAEDAQIFFENKGIELSMTEVEEMAKTFDKIASGEISQEMIEKAASGELSEDELEEVAGGIAFLPIMIIAGLCIGGVGGTSYGLTKFGVKW